MDGIEAIIERRFPQDLMPFDRFEQFFDVLLDDVRGPAVDVVSALRRAIEDEARRADGSEPPRDRWQLFGDQLPTKSARSTRSKLARDIEHDEGVEALRGARLSRKQVRARILAFSDLARCRIICTLNQDVRYLQGVLLAGGRLMERYSLRGEVKDFVFEVNRRGVLHGHRARQFSVHVPAAAGDEFGFEVQLMTILQHAWDRRNHPLYEWTRDGGELPDELRVNDFACSETLHLVDQQGERNWNDFIKVWTDSP